VVKYVRNIDEYVAYRKNFP